jgi:hypothetical protein
MGTTIRTALAVLVATAIVAVLAQDQLPRGETIVDKYIEVTGGKAAYEKIRSEVVTGSMTFPAMGIKGTLTVYHAEPALMVSEINIEGIGKIQEGTDGTVAWSLSAMQGGRLKDGEEKAEALREAAMHSDINWRDYFTKAETIGVENVDGKACYKVVLTPKEGSPQTRFYDKETNLLLKSTRKLKTPMGEIEAESAAADYRYNVTIPREKFDLPEEIKALIAKGTL